MSEQRKAAMARSRAIRRQILTLLDLDFSAGAHVGYGTADLIDGMASACEFSEHEIRRELRSLAEDSLVRTAGEGAETRYLLTGDGHDFFAAGCPWERVNRFADR